MKRKVKSEYLLKFKFYFVNISELLHKLYSGDKGTTVRRRPNEKMDKIL